MEIREARPEEFDALGDITVAAYKSLEGGHLDPGYEAMLRSVADRAVSAVVLVAIDAGALVGGVTYVPAPGPYAEFEGDDEAGVRMLAVDPYAQGKGAGTILMRACIGRAEAERKARLVLHSTPWMTSAHRIYDRLGFRRAPDRDWQPLPAVPLLGFVLDLGAAEVSP